MTSRFFILIAIILYLTTQLVFAEEESLSYQDHLDRAKDHLIEGCIDAVLLREQP